MNRRIELPGCNNFRDLGGYPAGNEHRVRSGQLFRSDGLHLLTPVGVRRFVGELGIRLIVDLRSTGEIGADGRGPLAGEPPDYRHLPLFDGALVQQASSAAGAAAEAAAEYTLADRYYLMAEYAKEPIRKVVTSLATATGPAVYHCAAGKDRTGVISAILLGLLGVRDEIIVADYAATQDNLDAIVERLMQSQGYRDVLESLPADTMHAEPDTMYSLLEKLAEKYGSVRGYAHDIGLSDATVDRLAARMLEPV